MKLTEIPSVHRTAFVKGSRSRHIVKNGHNYEVFEDSSYGESHEPFSQQDMVLIVARDMISQVQTWLMREGHC